MSKHTAKRQFDALPDDRKLRLLTAVFNTLEYDVDGNHGAEWSPDTLQDLGNLFEAYGVRFTSPEDAR